MKSARVNAACPVTSHRSHKVCVRPDLREKYKGSRANARGQTSFHRPIQICVVLQTADAPSIRDVLSWTALSWNSNKLQIRFLSYALDLVESIPIFREQRKLSAQNLRHNPAVAPLHGRVGVGDRAGALNLNGPKYNFCIFVFFIAAVPQLNSGCLFSYYRNHGDHDSSGNRPLKSRVPTHCQKNIFHSFSIPFQCWMKNL